MRNDHDRLDANRNEDPTRETGRSGGDHDAKSRQEGERHAMNRQDGGRDDAGRFGGGFYEGGQRENGMGGRYEAEGYGGSMDGYQGDYRGGYGGYRGGGYQSGYQGGYGGGFQGDYGNAYGGGRFGGPGAGAGYGGYYDAYRGRYDMRDHQDGQRDSGGGMTWMIAAGAALAAVGGYALYRTTMGTKHHREGRSRWRGIHVEESVTISKPASEIYRHWSNLENLGQILSHVEKVETLPNGRSRWTAKGPAGRKVEWDAETVQDRQNERITWRSVPGADVPNEGSVWFEERSGGRGTEVHVSLMYHPPGGALAAGLASLFGKEPHQQVADDLRRFKQRMEAGETIGDAHKSPSARTSGNV